MKHLIFHKVVLNNYSAVMTILFHTLENRRPLKIVSETKVHMDGHPILCYNYNIYMDGEKQEVGAEKDGSNKDDKFADPDFLGTITFEKPGQIFTYTAGGGRTLDATEVEEVIEYISHIRDNPALWRSADI